VIVEAAVEQGEGQHQGVVAAGLAESGQHGVIAGDEIAGLEACETSAPGTTFSASSSATGHIDGALFGPASQNIGAVWSLSDGTVSAMGTIAGKQ